VKIVLRKGVKLPVGKMLDAMVDAYRYVVDWERKESPVWRIDGDGTLRTLTVSIWVAGMDLIRGKTVTEMNEVVRFKEEE